MTNHVETVADVLNELHGWNDGPMLCALADRIAAAHARALDAQQSDAVAWMVRNRETKKIFWDEVCVWGDEWGAKECADEINDGSEDAVYEAFPLYTSPTPAMRAVVEALRLSEAFIMGAEPRLARDRDEAVADVLPAVRAALAEVAKMLGDAK